MSTSLCLGTSNGVIEHRVPVEEGTASTMSVWEANESGTSHIIGKSEWCKGLPNRFPVSRDAVIQEEKNKERSVTYCDRGPQDTGRMMYPDRVKNRNT